MPKPRLTSAVVRGLENWETVMELLLSVPDDSELQVYSADEIADCRRAFEWVGQLTTHYNQTHKSKELNHENLRNNQDQGD